MENEIEKYFTDDELDNLGSFVGILPEKNMIYTPKAWKAAVQDTSKWPKFHIRPLNNIDMAYMEDNAGEIIYKEGAGVFKATQGSQRIFILRNNIIKVENFFVKTENKFLSFTQDGGKLPEKVIALFSVELQKDLLNVIIKGSTISEDEKLGL